jgi:hypothetical protein
VALPAVGPGPAIVPMVVRGTGTRLVD